MLLALLMRPMLSAAVLHARTLPRATRRAVATSSLADVAPASFEALDVAGAFVDCTRITLPSMALRLRQYLRAATQMR